MTALSDILTVGLVLILLFGSIALYLYTRIQQAEQKISLLESILLDLKMSTEVKSYTELPAHETYQETQSPQSPKAQQAQTNELDSYTPYEDLDTVVEEPDKEVSNTYYDTMTLKELQSLAKTRGLASAMKKGQLIEALKLNDLNSDKSESKPEPGLFDSPILDTSITIEESK